MLLVMTSDFIMLFGSIGRKDVRVCLKEYLNMDFAIKGNKVYFYLK